MNFRVVTRRDVWVGSALITMLSVAVPVIIVSLAMYPVPFVYKIIPLAISAGIPLFIAMPISLFCLNMLKTINHTVDAVNNLVRFDALTNVLCRSHFYQLWRETRRGRGFLAIVDADHFKSINDNHGHDVGDEALRHIANAMTQTIGSHGIVGRLGGEEFCVFMPDVTRAQAELMMAQLGTWLRNKPFRLGAIERTVTVSIGLTEDLASDPLGVVIRRADQCLYAAKQNGRDRCVSEIELESLKKAA